MKKVLILLLLPITFFSQSTAKEMNVVVKKHLGLLNEYRLNNNINELKLDTKLCNLAQKWAKHMFDTNNFIHSNYNYAENIYYTTYSEDIALQSLNGWKNSAEHNENMLKPHNLVGIGFFKGYAVQIFDFDPWNSN